MTRTRRFADAIWSGYALTAITSVLNLITIPIALAVLGKEAFGLWSAVLQVTTLAAVFDMGLGPSLARFVTDYKDQPEKGEYGQFVKSVLVVGWLQTALFGIASAVAVPLLPGMMSIPAEQARLFKLLVAVQLGTTALGFPLRVFSQLLYANQLLATLNSLAILGTSLYAIVLVVGLHSGMGIYSYLAASWASFLIIQISTVVLAYRRGLVPEFRNAPVSFRILKPLASFSSQVLLIVVGLQLIAFAPTLLITRKLGLAALADWTVGTRLAMLGWQLVTRITGSSEPIFWEMFSRGEVARLRSRLLDLGRLAGSMAALLGGGVVAVNAPFVALWTQSRVQWWSGADVLLFLWIVVFAAASVFNMVPGITKRVGSMKYVYVLEGLAMVALAYMPFPPIRREWQVAMVLVAAVAVFRFPYGVARACKDLAITGRELGGFLGRCTASAAALLALALLLHCLTVKQRSLTQVLVNGVSFSVLALPCLYAISLPSEIKSRIRLGLGRRFPRLAPLLK